VAFKTKRLSENSSTLGDRGKKRKPNPRRVHLEVSTNGCSLPENEEILFEEPQNKDAELKSFRSGTQDEGVHGGKNPGREKALTTIGHERTA